MLDDTLYACVVFAHSIAGHYPALAALSSSDLIQWRLTCMTICFEGKVPTCVGMCNPISV